MPARLHSSFGEQLTFFDNDGDVSAQITAWRDDQILRREGDSFRRRLESGPGLRSTTAAVRERHLLAMVRRSRAGTAERFFSRPETVVDAIRSATRNQLRNERHLTVQDYFTYCADALPGGAVERCRDAIAAGFAGRMTPHPSYVDRSLGGSKKLTRDRVPLDWVDGERLIEAAGERDGASYRPRRDRALLALHTRSGIPAGAIRTLEWSPGLIALFGSSWLVQEFWLDIGAGPKPFAIHRTALTELDALWHAGGSPLAGPVFTTSSRPRVVLSDRQTADLVRDAIRGAGYPPIDRRHLRGPFARWLSENEGWAVDRVRDALGFERIRDARRLLDRMAEAPAQLRAREILGFGDVGATTPVATVFEFNAARPSRVVRCC